MAGVRGMKKGVRRDHSFAKRRVHATMEQQLAKPMLRASGGRAAIGNSPGKRGMAASAKNLLKKVKGRARQPVQIVRNQICLTGGLLGSTHVCVPVNADGEGREWVQLKASLPWLVAATTGKGSIRRSCLKYVTLMAEVREQLSAAAGPEVAPEANALAPAGEGPSAADDPLLAMLRKRGLETSPSAAPARPCARAGGGCAKTMAGKVEVGSFADPKVMDARAPRVLSLRGRGGTEAAVSCEILLTDLPWAIEHMRREVEWKGVPQEASGAGVAGGPATCHPLALAPAGGSAPELTYDQVSSKWFCDVVGQRLFIEVPSQTQSCKRVPLSVASYLANKERARCQLLEAAKAELAEAGLASAEPAFMEAPATPAAAWGPRACGGKLDAAVVDLSD